jgi:eukaryotic-like serine/threonine-protein kinase
MPQASVTAETIFGKAISIPQAAEREAYLQEICAGDAELRSEVERLVRDHFRAGHFLEQPAIVVETVPPPPAAERPGTLIGPYKLLEQIREGGMGLVYMAEQQRPVRRLVALKIIKPGMDSQQVIARFEAERQALAMMDHPNIAKVLDAGTVGDRRASVPACSGTSEDAYATGRPYFVMELVRGIPINEFCDQKRLNVRQRLELFIQVCQAVQHAHQRGIIHRDLKPSNVLVTMADTVPVPKVIDFGIAKALGASLTEHTLHTGFAQLIGTPLYMSPEQAEMNQFGVDTRSDVYSLGVLLYEVLTGTTPFDKERLKSASFDEMRRIICEEEPETVSSRIAKTRRTGTRGSVLGTKGSDSEGRPSTPSPEPRTPRLTELDWIVAKSLEKDRNRRYESASAFAADVQRYLNDEPVQACPPSATYRFRKFAARHRTALSTAALITATLVVGTLISVWQALRATTAEKLATERLAAVDRERQRAEKGEQQAKDAAAKAAKAEASARKAAAENQVIFEFFQDKILAAGRPQGEAGGLGKDVTLRQAVDAAEPAVAAAFKDNPLVEARVRETLAQTYHLLGEPDLSLKQALRELELTKGNLPASSEDILLAMGHVGSEYLATGKPDEALPLLEEAFNQAKSKYGSDSPSTGFCMQVLAKAYQQVGKFDQAVELAEEALQIKRTTCGPEHPTTLVAMNELAVAYSYAGKREQAIKLLEEVVALNQAKFGPKYPETLTSLHNLGTHYLEKGKIDQALSIFQEEVNVRTAQLGQEHPHTLEAMEKLGRTYLQAGKIDLALPLLEQAFNWTRTKLV